MKPLPLLLVLLTAMVTGCAPCTQSCSAEAKIFARCLDQWDLEWADLGADDEEDFQDRCSSASLSYVASLEQEAASREEQRCSGLADVLRDETDCEAAWEALVSYGVEP